MFDELFPRLAAAIAHADRGTARPYSRDYLEDVHRAALILLYRLLFVLYAEDRALLPVNDKRYHDYSLRWLRDDIARRMDWMAWEPTAKGWYSNRSLFVVRPRARRSVSKLWRMQDSLLSIEKTRQSKRFLKARTPDPVPHPTSSTLCGRTSANCSAIHA